MSVKLAIFIALGFEVGAIANVAQHHWTLAAACFALVLSWIEIAFHRLEQKQRENRPALDWDTFIARVVRD